MSRSVAFVAFLALSWSHVAGLRCDMGATEQTALAGSAHAAAHPPTPHQSAPSHAHGPTHADGTPTSPHPQSHGAPHGCLMIMACSIASPRPAHPAAMIRIPAVLVRADFPTPPIPVAADLAVETPPPRHTV